jgi:hypothetical protein
MAQAIRDALELKKVYSVIMRNQSAFSAKEWPAAAN